MAEKTRADKPAIAKGVFSAAAAVAAAAMVIRPLIPGEIKSLIRTHFIQFIINVFSTDFVVVIEEFDGLSRNDLFKAAETYTATIVSNTMKRCRATIPPKEKKISVAMETEEELFDEFRGMKLKWRMVTTPARYHNPGGARGGYSIRASSQAYELSFHKKCRARVLDEYLPYVVEKSKVAETEKKRLRLYSYDKLTRDETGIPTSWKSVVLDHPATFDTLAMDSDLKQMLINDIDQFLARKEVYRRIGRAWKRGYLLYGPPGTGKSSLIAAMANYLKFDVYDLELTAIRSNSELQRLMTSTANQSILVVEDIDCSIDVTEKRKAKPLELPGIVQLYNSEDMKPKITLSGLLNFIDGLRSSCGDERIIIFTTNHIEKLDPALLRPGRMDVHIHMSYITPEGFRLLASNYLGISDHPMFSDVERELSTVQVTPAEVGEQLLRFGEPDVAMKGLVQFLEEKRNVVRVHREVEPEPQTAQDVVQTNPLKLVRGTEDGAETSSC